MDENRRFENLLSLTVKKQTTDSGSCRLVLRLPDGVWKAGSGLDLVFHAKAAPFDDDRFGVMEESVQNRRGEGSVIIEDAGPLFEGFVGGQHDGAAFLALADDLEKQIGTMLVDGQIAELIQD